MSTAHHIMTNLIERVKNMQEFTIQFRMDTLVLNGPVPFDFTHSNDVATATVYALNIEEAKIQVTDYFGSVDFI